MVAPVEPVAPPIVAPAAAASPNRQANAVPQSPSGAILEISPPCNTADVINVASWMDSVKPSIPA